ncbi:hypothetical protein ACFP3I_14800 [Chryseobacterium arachidis]|uniref:hypothetical protein n=1 Tax=Chryseobacterium arachidis TaxID=1416778 RepID=UPI003616EC1F
MNIDKALEYNNEGVIVKEIDFSQPNFTFSIYQLIEKVKNEFNIDLNNSVDWKIDMLVNNPKKIYEWLVIGHILNKEQHLRHLKTLRFDGATGKFMSMEDGYYGFNAIE